MDLKQIARTTEKLRGNLQELLETKGESVTEEIIQKGQELNGLLHDFVSMIKKKI